MSPPRPAKSSSFRLLNQFCPAHTLMSVRPSVRTWSTYGALPLVTTDSSLLQKLSSVSNFSTRREAYESPSPLLECWLAWSCAGHRSCGELMSSFGLSCSDNTFTLVLFDLWRLHSLCSLYHIDILFVSHHSMHTYSTFWLFVNFYINHCHYTNKLH